MLTYLGDKTEKKVANTLSETEMGIIEDLAQHYGLIGKLEYIGQTNKVVPFMAILNADGSERPFTIRKMNHRFYLNAVVHSKATGKKEVSNILNTQNWNELVKRLHSSFSDYTATQIVPTKDKNGFSVSEVDAIYELVKKYPFSAKQSILSPNIVPYIAIHSNMGSRILAVRKFEHMYEILNAVNPDMKNWEKMQIEPTFKEMMGALDGMLFNFTEGDIPQFSPDEAKAIGKLASDNNHHINGKVMKLKPGDYKVAVLNVLGPDLVSPIWTMYHDKDNVYKLYKVLGNTWDLFYSSNDFDAFFKQLEIYLHGQDTAASMPSHNGITSEEYNQIREAVAGYGDEYWAEWIDASPGQSAYVEIHKQGVQGPMMSIGALGNYYQINTAVKENAPTFNSVMARIHDKLAEDAGKSKTVAANELSEITSLAKGAGFNYIAPEGDEPYTFVRGGDETISVQQYGVASYEHDGVFGPTIFKTLKAFIQWFKSTYMTGKVPETSEKFANNMMQVLDSGGFMNKDTGQVIPHQKINAIKAFRYYIMQVTGGQCGLGKSKYAIENLELFLANVVKYGLPNMDTHAPDLAIQWEKKKLPEPPAVINLNKFTDEEQMGLAQLISKYAPALNYQITTNDAIVLWVGNLTSYKIDKDIHGYFIYTDKDAQWAPQAQFGTYKELYDYLSAMLAHIAKALKNTKLGVIGATDATPEKDDPDALSPSEVVVLKALIKQFKLPVATNYSKKLMEAKEPKGQKAYSMVVSDPEHQMSLKITKKQGGYVFEKGTGGDANYYILKTFSLFKDLVAYVDYFFNSYIFDPKVSMIQVVPFAPEQLKLIKDLVKKYYPKAKVRQKYMSDKAMGIKVPFLHIDNNEGNESFALGKHSNGKCKLYKVDKIMDTWETGAETDSFEGMYDILAKVMSGEALPDEKGKYNIPVLTEDEFEWLTTFFKTNKPQVLVKRHGNGVVSGSDPSNQILGAANPLFVIRYSPGSTQQRILQVHTQDGGKDYEEYPFNTSEALFHFINKNIEVVTQLLKGDDAPESKLAALITKFGFEFKDHASVSVGAEAKPCSHYENEDGEVLYLANDGTSRLWAKEGSSGNIKHDFKTIAQLVDWMEKKYEGKTDLNIIQIQEHLAYLGFVSDEPSNKFSQIWVRPNPTNYVHLHTDGTSKVAPAPMQASGSPSAASFFFKTFNELKHYLTNKYVKGEPWANSYFSKVLSNGGFKKKENPDAEMGYDFEHNKVVVVPFPSGGLMYTKAGISPPFKFSFDSTYDLAYQLGLWVEGPEEDENEEDEPTTGIVHLDELLEKAKFIYQGQEDAVDGGKTMVFMKEDGTRLKFHPDLSSTVVFPDSKGVSFPDATALIDFLMQTNGATINLKSLPEQTILSSAEAKPIITDFLLPNIGGYKVSFQYTNKKPFQPSSPVPLPAAPTGEIRVMDGDNLKFAIGIVLDPELDSGKLWYVRQNAIASSGPTNDIPHNEVVETFTTKNNMMTWIKENMPFLLSNIQPPGYKKKHEASYAKSYYDDLGDAQMAYSIRLTKEDDDEMKKMGWVFMHASETQIPSAYYNSAGYKVTFLNKSLKTNAHKPIAIISEPGALGASKVEFDPSVPAQWDIPKIIQFLKEHPQEPPSAGPNSTMAEGNESVLKYDGITQTLITKHLNKVKFPEGMVQSIHFQYNNKNDGTGEVRVAGNNLLRFAIGKKMYPPDSILWYVRQKVSDNPMGLYVTYTFMSSHVMAKWIVTHAKELASHHTIKNEVGGNAGIASNPQPPSQPLKQEDFKGKMYYPDSEIVDLLNHKGFKAQMLVNGTTWRHPSKFSFELYEKGIAWHCEKSTKEVGIPQDKHHDFLKKALKHATSSNNDDELDFMFSQASSTREEKLFEQAIDMAAEEHGELMEGTELSAKLMNKGFAPYLEEKCWVNDDLLQLVIINPSSSAQSIFKFAWIEDKEIQWNTIGHEDGLMAWIGPSGNIETGKKLNTDKQTGGWALPSGEDYQMHDVAGNAELIWLNHHDENLLAALGFKRVPQENRYYKNVKGDIIKFTDMGTAEFHEVNSDGNVSDTTEFKSIPHALNFLVAKYSAVPFSTQNYKDDDGEHVYEIQLNPNDDAVMENLGFEYDGSSKHYIKFCGLKNTPSLEEAKKKKKKSAQQTMPLSDPKQPELPLGDPNSEKPVGPDDPGEMPPDEHEWHEIFTAYDTGNAIWQSVSEETESITEQQEGTIYEVLTFIWNRWHHEMTSKLKGAPSLSSQQPSSKLAGTAFSGKTGVMMPPNIHEKFLKRGFTFEASTKEYYKEYKGDLWTSVIFDGHTYFMSYPHKTAGGFTHYEKSNEDPFYMLNRLTEIEQAEFGDLVKTVEQALIKGDGNYFNAPPEWKKFNPYAPKANPDSIKPEAWQDKELEAYGFTWKDDGKMYWLMELGDKNVQMPDWEAVRFDKAGYIVYFYHTDIANPRYFVSKDFAKVLQKIEIAHSSKSNKDVAAAANAAHVLNSANYPAPPKDPKLVDMAPDGLPLKLNEKDHMAVLKAGFKFLMNAAKYIHTNGDEFKMYQNGMVLYHMAGTGTGWTDIGHWFDMLKSKYQQLSMPVGQTLSGYDVVAIKDKLEKLGFVEKPNNVSPEDLYFYRDPKLEKTTMHLQEMVVIFPNHSMTYYLLDKANQNSLGAFAFDSVKYGLHVLNDHGASGIALQLVPQFEDQLKTNGFAYIPKSLRYEAHPFGTSGVKISLTFYGDGTAWAHKLIPQSDGTTEVETDKTFNNFYNAIIWSAAKNFDESDPGGPPPKPPTKPKTPVPFSGYDYSGWAKGEGHHPDSTIGLIHEDEKTMLKLGFQQIFNNGIYYYRNVKGDTLYFFVDGRARLTHKDGKSQTEFNTIKEVMQYLWDNSHHVTTPEPPPFNAETVKKQSELIKRLQDLDFVYMSANSNGGVFEKDTPDVLYHLVWDISAGTMDYTETRKADKVTLQTWVQPVPEAMMVLTALFSAPDFFPGYDVVKELKDLGFKQKGSGNEIMFDKYTKHYAYIVVWNKTAQTLHYSQSVNKIKKGYMKLVKEWTMGTGAGLAALKTMFNAAEDKPKKKVLAGTEDMPWSGTDYMKWGMTVLPAIGASKGMGLHPTEEKTLKSMGWERGKTPYGETYTNGPQGLVFYISGLTKYFSMLANGNVTQEFMSVEDALRWLWKNYPHYAKKPYPNKKANVEAILKHLGFKTTPMSIAKAGTKPNAMQANGEAWMLSDGKVVHVVIFDVGKNTLIWHTKPADFEGTGNTTTYDTIQKGMNALIGKFNPNAPKAKPGEMPWSGHHYDYSQLAIQQGKQPVYTSITLVPQEEDTLKNLGFNRLESADVKWYEKAGTGQNLMFFADGHASITDKVTGTEMDHFDTVKEAIQFLWNKYSTKSKTVTASPPKKTGDMPYSGTDYGDWWTNYWPDTPKNASISLKPEDDEVMKQMGFEKKVNPMEDADIAFKYTYQKGEERAYFFASGKAAYWKEFTDGPYYFNTVKDLMTYLWAKHSPFIEEGTFKSWLREWL